MNRISKRSAVMLAALLAATCLHVIVTAAAPAAFQGIFKLSHEVRWGKAVLPAGEYLLRVEYSGPATLVTIGEAKTGKTIDFLVSVASEGNKDGKRGECAADRHSGWAGDRPLSETQPIAHGPYLRSGPGT